MLHIIANKKESSNHFEALFEYATMGILIADSNGKIIAINPFALHEFGYKEKELTGKKIETLIPSRFHQNHIHHREKYSESPQTRPMGTGMDLFALRKDGTEFPVEVSLGSYHNNGDKFIIAFISNISIRKKAEAEIEKLNDDLEATVKQRTSELTSAMHQLEHSKEELSKTLEKEKELSELKSRFVSIASHEFRTPLSTVLSSAYLIEKYATTDEQPKREKHLGRIVSSVNMLIDILNDFLSVGKIEEGKIQVRLTQFNIKELVSNIIEEIKNNMKKKQAILYHHEGNPLVLLDASFMKHIIMNLVSNASKFSPELSPVEIKTISDDHRITLSVKDYGMGISKEDQKHLMERFFRGTNVANIQGTGLGLHIVAKYAELMNGRVEFKSELEKGTEFVITFNDQMKDAK
jgi:PAS domain S-box-containing protein